ncbi:KAP family P-loop NTPase fold protein [Ralstonia pseudosolanacearum]
MSTDRPIECETACRCGASAFRVDCCSVEPAWSTAEMTWCEGHVTCAARNTPSSTSATPSYGSTRPGVHGMRCWSRPRRVDPEGAGSRVVTQDAPANLFHQFRQLHGMQMTTNPLPLALSADPFKPFDPCESSATPFDGDLLGREQLARRLTDYVYRLHAGAVLAIDAPWGEGKTWFAGRWATDLWRSGHRVGFIDAFQQDYAEDPFLLLAAEIRRLCAADADASRRLADKAAKVGAVLLPVATKAAINLAGKVIGAHDLVGEFSDALQSAGEKGADAAQAWVKRKLEDHEKEQGSVNAFRKELKRFAGTGDKPVVIFIDELDRCRPAFAVRLIERIKHFFDVPNLVFVLVMNREQLEHAIRGVYGAETNAAQYLGKFLHLSLRLSKEQSLTLGEPDHQIKGFVNATLQRYGYVDKDRDLEDALAACAVALNLSLRDIERACALFFLAKSPWHGLLAYLAALKVKHPALFDGVRTRDHHSLQECRRLLQIARERLSKLAEGGGYVSEYFRALIALLEPKEPAPTPERLWLEQNLRYLFSALPRMELDEAFDYALSQLDLDIR